MGGGPESRCVGRVSGLEGAVRRHLPKAKETSINYIVASSWHFTVFQGKGANMKT